MSRILVCSLLASGHLNPLIAIAQQLQADGHQVIMAVDHSYHQQIKKAGLEPVALNYPAGMVSAIIEQFQKPARWVSQVQIKAPQTYFFDYLEHLVEQLITIIKRFQPDVVLSDLNYYAGPIAADVCNVPYASYCAVVNTLNTPDAPPYGLGSDWLPVGHPLRMTWPFLNLPVQLVLWRHDLIANRIRHKFGLAKKHGILLAHSPYLGMVPMTDAYAYPRLTVPKQIMYVGPVTSAQRGETHDDFPWEWLDDGRPTVYVSMGTIVGAVHVFKAAIEAAANQSRWKAIMTVGRNTDISQFGTLPENVLMRNFVPQLDVLKHVDAVVSHGGNNTITETLMHGLPILVIPYSADQPESAGRVKACGAGLRLRPSLATGERLRSLIDRILFDDTFREKAQQVQASYARTQGAVTASRLVGLLAEHQTPLMRAKQSPTVTLEDLPTIKPQSSSSRIDSI